VNFFYLDFVWALPNLFFDLCKEIHVEEAVILFGKELRDAVEDTMVSEYPYFGD
jgi:hypothetical protein